MGVSDAVRPSGKAPHGTSLLPADLTDDQLATEMDFPWGQRGAISRLLAIIPHHHHEHREDVEKWLAARESSAA